MVKYRKDKGENCVKSINNKRGFAFLIVLLFVLAGGGLLGATKVVFDAKKAAKLISDESSVSVLPNTSDAEDTSDASGETTDPIDASGDSNAAPLRCVTTVFDGVSNLVVDTEDGAGNGTNRWCVTDSGNAAAGDVLSNRVVWVDGIAVTGTMANNGQFNLIAGATDTTVIAGYYSGGTLSGDADLTSANILSGITIFGISGNSNVVNTSSGNATATDILSGQIAYVDGSEVTGTMPTQTLSAANDTLSAGNYTATTLSVVDTDLASGNILSGVTIFGIAGNSNVVNTSSGNATATDILSGQIAYVDGSVVTGILATQTLSALNDTVSAGNYTATTLSAVDTDLASGNILSGVTIFGIAGNSNVVNTSTGTANATDLLSGLVAWVDGAEVTGTMNNNGLFALTAGTADQSVTAGYYSGGTLTGDTDLATSNILSGVTIFGIAGNSNVVNTSTGTATAGDLLSGLVAWVDGASITGTIPTNTLSVLNDTVSAGYYAATTLSAVDTDLATGNILSGKTIFGFAGNSNVVNTATGTATAGGLLSGLVAWVDGSEVTGTIPTNTLSAENDTVSAGYYTATTLSAVDADLLTGNIRSGTTIFGVVGNSNVVNTSSGTATAADLLSGLIAWVDGLEVTGTMATQTLSALNGTVSAGYYAATTLSAVDTNLIAGNIISGATIFGVAGNAVVGYTYGDSVQTTVLTTATSAGTYNAANLSVGTVKSGTAFGVGLTGDYPSATYPLAGAGTVAGAADVGTGKVAWSNDGTQITGSGTVTVLTPSGACSTQQYVDHLGSATEENNCSLTWTTNATPVTGDDNKAGRGGYDPRTGLTWSQYLKNNAGTVEFAASGGNSWNWNGQLRFIVTAANATAGATYTNNGNTFTVVTTITGTTTLTTTPTGSAEASGTLTKTAGTGDDTIVFSLTQPDDINNAAVGGKTASELCSDRGNGWRLPSQKELLQAYIDGIYWNLTNAQSASTPYWTMTEYVSNYAYIVIPTNGYTSYAFKLYTYYVRCVR